MITEAHIAESLSRAYVRAIAGRAGLNLSFPEFDYGSDGRFDEVISLGGQYFPTGYSLSYQLKASTRWQKDDTDVIHDLDVRAYNILTRRYMLRAAVPCILILLTLPEDPSEWLHNSEQELLLAGGCYWMCVKGPLTGNSQSVRIRIPRGHLLTPESLSELIGKIRTGEEL